MIAGSENVLITDSPHSTTSTTNTFDYTSCISSGNSYTHKSHNTLSQTETSSGSQTTHSPLSGTFSLFSEDFRLITKLGIHNQTPSLKMATRSEIDEEIFQRENELITEESLIWVNPNCPTSPTFKSKDPPPYIVFMESIIQNLNIGKLNPIAIADLVRNVTDGPRLIQRNGINRVKITFENKEDANSLIMSKDIFKAKYRVYIPNSMKISKGIVRDIDCSISATEFAERLSIEDRTNLISIKRRISFNNQIIDTFELSYASSSIPENVIVSSFELPLKPIIPRPIRCDKCQRYRHVRAQCRSRYARCEFCGGPHPTDDCERKLERSHCCNCGGEHVASSTTCPTYIKENEIRKIRAELNVGYQEAEEEYKSRRGSTNSEDRTIISPGTHQHPQIQKNVDSPMDLSTYSASSLELTDENSSERFDRQNNYSSQPGDQNRNLSFNRNTRKNQASVISDPKFNPFPQTRNNNSVFRSDKENIQHTPRPNDSPNASSSPDEVQREAKKSKVSEV